ncbi:MAG: response regulator [Candidatus Omnitrophota bacterium]|nr:response regulator [Candidatus Omnitrophota bacterium]
MSSKILVVDDEAPVRDMFKELLKKQGYQVFTVATGEEALEAVAKEDFDAVLLDVKLTGISGLETLKIIKERKPELIVIMITGFGYDDELVTKSNEYGCSGYIGKNADISQIIHCFKCFIKEAKEKNNK